MPIVADTYDLLVGVDTHAAIHTFAIIDAATGAILEHREFPTSPAGLRRAQDWIRRRTAVLSAVNLAEVHQKLAQHGVDADRAVTRLRTLGIRIEPLDAITASKLWPGCPSVTAAAWPFWPPACRAP